MKTNNYQIGPFNNLVLLGGGLLLMKICRWAIENKYGVTVITSPRHAEDVIEGSSLESALKKLKVPFYVFEKLDGSELQRIIPKPEETFSLSLGAAWIFNEPLISSVFKNNLFNLHGTRLPQNRGSGGFSWQILTGNRFGFVNIHKMEEGIDEGEILFSKEFLYPPSCRTPKDYLEIYRSKCYNFIAELLELLKNEAMSVRAISQPEYLSSYWPRLNTEIHGWIDWRWEAAYLERFICAFDDPYSGAHTMWNDKRVFLKKVSLNLEDGHFHPFQSGIVYRKSADWICMAVKGAALIIEEIFNESNINIIEQIKVGDRFFTPLDFLEATSQRVVYLPAGLKMT